VRGKPKKSRSKTLVRPAPNPSRRPVAYQDFSRYVRQFKTQQLLRLIAKNQMLEWNEDKPVGSYLLKPHAGSLIAFEAMSGWGAQGQFPATIDDLGKT